MDAKNTKKQADILAKYLIGQSIRNETIYMLYAASVTSSTNNSNEDRVIRYAFTHQSLIPFLDAGFTLLRPSSELRRRIYIMFSILESTPEYADLFLPKKHLFIDVLSVIGSGLRSIFRAVIGIILIKVIRL